MQNNLVWVWLFLKFGIMYIINYIFAFVLIAQQKDMN